MSNETSEHPFFGKVVSVYTRAQALADGVLIDAGPMAREAGFRWPVAITAGAMGGLCDLERRRQPAADPSGSIRSLVGCAVHGRSCCADPRRRRRAAAVRALPRAARRPLHRSRAHHAEAGGGPGRRGRAGHYDPAAERGLNPPAKTGIFSLATGVTVAFSCLHQRTGIMPTRHR